MLERGGGAVEAGSGQRVNMYVQRASAPGDLRYMISTPSEFTVARVVRNISTSLTAVAHTIVASAAQMVGGLGGSGTKMRTAWWEESRECVGIKRLLSNINTTHASCIMLHISTRTNTPSSIPRHCTESATHSRWSTWKLHSFLYAVYNM